jgi:hypothetical protein
MKLPSRLNDLVSRDNALNSVVLKALALVEPWTLDNKTVFFHEYTDHSLKHLAEVLLTAEGLMSDDSWSHLTAEDGAVIVLSVLLHDCALHLSEDGFYSLIGGHYASTPSRYINGEPAWPTLWDQFFAEARRFDQRRLYALFGNTEPVQTLPTDKLDLTLKHRLLIGEFLRRHHARLAHEIAISGIPGPGAPLLLADKEYKDLMDLSGYVARSHNLSIRAAVDALESTQRRIHQNCKVPFVMMVLRIADYLQIHSSRAPGQLLRLRSLVSPISRGEWRKHLSVREINQAHEDPEAIFVDCEPDSAATFLGMQNLLRDIQAELDKSWALLGEIYGRFTPLNSLGITIRRIRSNLDDPEAFRRKRHPKYLPREFRFRTASAELMDLLVAPLYGEKPEIGVRELIQNAVDACRERDDLIAKGIALHEHIATDDVVVTLTLASNGTSTLVVEDFGVGMTPEVVDNYFLNIGASFRSSDLWRKNHEAAGHSTVHRTGRFGIGLLAAFLLGPEIRITTRSIASPEDSAITFTCQQGAESIEVRPCTFHSGTRIEIELSDEAAKKLAQAHDKWDWYCLKTPGVRRILSSDSLISLQQRYDVPECDSNLDSTKWRRITAEGYDDILWSYEALERWGGPDSVVICNGVFVSSYNHKLAPDVSSELGIIDVTDPSLVVFDADGRLPINLQRSEVITGAIGFERPLALDVSEYLVDRFVQTFEHLKPGITPENVTLSVQPRIPGLRRSSYRSSSNLAFFVLSNKGVIPCDADLIRKAGITNIFIDAANLSGRSGAFTCPSISKWAEHYVAVDGVTRTKISRTNFLRDSIGGISTKGDPTGYFAPLKVVGRRILVRKSDVTELVSPGNVPRWLWGTLSLEEDLNTWGLWSSGLVPDLTLDLENVCAELDSSGGFGITLLYFDKAVAAHSEPKSQPSPLAETWDRVVHSPLLRQRPR